MAYWLLSTPWLAAVVPPGVPAAPGRLGAWLGARAAGVCSGDCDEWRAPWSAAHPEHVVLDAAPHTWHAFGGTTFSAGRGDVPLLALGLYTAAASVTMALSVAYHIFMPATSRASYATLLKVDVAGVWLVNVAGWALSLFAVGACALPLHLRLAPVAVWGGVTLAMIVRAETAAQRGVPLLLIALPRLAGFPARLWAGAGPWDATALWAVSEAVAVVGGAVNVARLPERWFPGRYDVFHSHTIMHVLAVVAIALAHLAASWDRAWVLGADHSVRVCLAAEGATWLPPVRAAVAAALGVDVEGIL